MALLNDFVVCHIRNLFHVVPKYTLMLEIGTSCIGIGWFIWGWFIFSLHAVAHKEIIRDAYHCIPENQLLVEVPLQQALKRFSMPGFVRGSSPSGLHLAGGASTLKRFDIAGF